MSEKNLSEENKKIGRFDNINPLDHRYAAKEGISELRDYLSESAKVDYQLRVETALVKKLAEFDFCDDDVYRQVKDAAEEVTAAEVYEEEKKTKHNIRALANCLQRRVSEKARPFIHFTATSSDIIDTANSLRYKEAIEEEILPALKDLQKKLMAIARREKDTLQIGRTHGQHAVPITFGFALSEYVSRLGGRIQTIQRARDELKGQLSGAVGAYNAIDLFLDEPEEFEKEVLSELGLEPASHSTQIVEPEFTLDLVHGLVSAMGVMANLSDDMRHLQRSEISEVGEYFEEGQVGSSTMPHKMNPINYENIKSMWKEFSARMVTRYNDQISEHQRDLSNSASSRFIPEILAAFHISINRLQKVMEKFSVFAESMRENYDLNSDLVAAEPLYILLAYHGHPDAHEAVRVLSMEAREKGVDLQDLVVKSDKLADYWQNFTADQQQIIRDPESYIGRSVEKTEAVVSGWEEKLDL
ncbi:adenylosuccinate lyase [Halarsenatibacter silvermanii]|uniref:Adenylosuccinate lyase n=1 Tax=Halarsenatibacter silvermanii TaxID=321763 RepID=A0A1G9PWD0_9FIRM|nr:adenylosuccinate lyase [Halarsenatibacter silvermanii]SDM02435.1 adenylosuccinate lyase [Halarsenatibacter silvermanii]